MIKKGLVFGIIVLLISMSVLSSVSSRHIHIENHSPSAPTINGPTSGKPRVEYDFIFNSVDLDGDDVSYYIDWGDGTSYGWTNYNPSGTDVTVPHTWEEIDWDNFVRAKAKDIFGFESDWSNQEMPILKSKANIKSTSDEEMFISNSIMDNHPPYAPSNYYPCGETEPIPLVVNLSWDGGDPDPGDTITYDVYFDNVNPPFNVTTVGPYPWNQTRIEYGPVELENYTIYYMMICAYDNYSAYIEGPICSFTTSDNHPPYKPTITGPMNGPPGKHITFTFNAVDPDGDDVRYLIDWGDGNAEWTNYVASGTDKAVSHMWDSRGTYTITVCAEDEYGNIGPEATNPIPITRDKSTNNVLFWRSRFLEPFPLLERLLSLLID